MENDSPINLENLLGKKIKVHLKGGKTLQGSLKKVDDYMNLVLKNVEEKKQNETVQKYDIVVVKGGNARSITKSN